MNDVTYGNSTYVAVGQSGKILTSSDGTSWTSRTSGTTSSLKGITYGNGNFLTMTGSMDNGSTATVLTSSNGTSWTLSSATCSTSSCGTTDFSINDITYSE